MTSPARPPHATTPASTRREPTLGDLALGLAVVALPLLTLVLASALADDRSIFTLPDAASLARFVPTPRSIALYLAWFALQLGFMRWLPGRRALGVPTLHGDTLGYTMNGGAAFALTLLLAFALVHFDLLPATLLSGQLLPLVATANLFAFLLCLYVYRLGRAQARGAERDRTVLSAFFHGAALNPRSGGIDWKFFCESRPGMILWVLVDLSMAAAERERFGHLSAEMVLVCLFQAFYVADYFFHEEAILTTWDIRHEPFGFMLCWGCLVFIPFTFSLQATYLSRHDVHLPAWARAAIALLQCAGYYVFRASNLQKHRFRSDPSHPIWGRPPRYIQTKQGGRLLVSGFWGLSRHANYLGDLMMGLAWCLTTGFGSVVAWFYFIYFVILLVHRERRDFAHCAKKYGADWEEYSREVPYRIVPGLY